MKYKWKTIRMIVSEKSDDFGEFIYFFFGNTSRDKTIPSNIEAWVESTAETDNVLVRGLRLYVHIKGNRFFLLLDMIECKYSDVKRIVMENAAKSLIERRGDFVDSSKIVPENYFEPDNMIVTENSLGYDEFCKECDRMAKLLRKRLESGDYE